MLKQANDKVIAEMVKTPDAYTQAIGNYLLTHLKCYPGVADKILAEGKTIKGSLDAMKKVAEGKKVGNYAVLTDEEGFAAVLKYYGIDAAGAAHAPQQAPKASADFNINLDDLLG